MSCHFDSHDYVICVIYFIWVSIIPVLSLSCLCDIISLTRMRSSCMCTACSLAVSCNIHVGGLPTPPPLDTAPPLRNADPLLDADSPGCRPPPGYRPPCGQTNTRENITLSQTSFAGGKIPFEWFSYQSDRTSSFVIENWLISFSSSKCINWSNAIDRYVDMNRTLTVSVSWLLNCTSCGRTFILVYVVLISGEH